LNKAEENYSVSELEMLQSYGHYASLGVIPNGENFTVRTVHAAVINLHKLSGNNARLLPWSLTLAEFDFIVQYSPATKIPHIHALFRYVYRASNIGNLFQDKVRLVQASDSYFSDPETRKPEQQN
jgi:hypothetical protein